MQEPYAETFTSSRPSFFYCYKLPSYWHFILKGFKDDFQVPKTPKVSGILCCAFCYKVGSALAKNIHNIPTLITLGDLHDAKIETTKLIVTNM